MRRDAHQLAVPRNAQPSHAAGTASENTSPPRPKSSGQEMSADGGEQAERGRADAQRGLRLESAVGSRSRSRCTRRAPVQEATAGCVIQSLYAEPVTAGVLRKLCLSFAGAVEFPFGPETSVFKVGGKMFALSASSSCRSR